MTEPGIHAASGDLEAIDLERRDGDVRPVEGHAETIVLTAWDRHHDEVYAFLLDATRDASTAEDMLQEAFMRLLREVREGRRPDQLRAWLYRVAGNLVVDRGRRLTTARRWLERVGIPGHRSAQVASPEVTLLEDEAARELDDVLGRLPADARTALLLSAEGFTGREIAGAIGRTEIATRTVLCRARVRVRRELAEPGGAR